MRRLQWLVSMAAVFAGMVIILISSFELGIYGGFGFYEKEYEKYEVTDDLEMEMSDVMYVTEEMMAYLRGKRDDLVVETTVNGRSREFFNDREKAHMVDVKNLFLGGLKLRTIAIVVLLISIVLLILMKANLMRVLSKAYQIGLVIFALLAGVAAYLFASDFTKYFYLFHEIFFTNDLWLLDPETDLMIRMLPEGFFFDMVTRIGIIFGVCILVLLMISMICGHFVKKAEDRELYLP